jgi:hypothetical protein
MGHPSLLRRVVLWFFAQPERCSRLAPALVPGVSATPARAGRSPTAPLDSVSGDPRALAPAYHSVNARGVSWLIARVWSPSKNGNC